MSDILPFYPQSPPLACRFVSYFFTTNSVICLNVFPQLSRHVALLLMETVAFVWCFKLLTHFRSDCLSPQFRNSFCISNHGNVVSDTQWHSVSQVKAGYLAILSDTSDFTDRFFWLCPSLVEVGDTEKHLWNFQCRFGGLNPGPLD